MGHKWYSRLSLLLVCVLIDCMCPVLEAKSDVESRSLQQSVYSLDTDFKPANFFNNFNFWDGDDPTHGFVRYVNESRAWSSGYIMTSKEKVFMSPDRFNVAPNGRESVRIESKKRWQYGLFVLVLDHMPGGQCGSWPAFWLCGEVRLLFFKLFWRLYDGRCIDLPCYQYMNALVVFYPCVFPQLTQRTWYLDGQRVGPIAARLTSLRPLTRTLPTK